MLEFDRALDARAAELAGEIAAAVRSGRAEEALEQLLGTALRGVVRAERERCARLAERRAEMWAASARRMSAGGTWPREGVVEAHERGKEATALGDAIRAEVDPPSSAV